MATALKSDRKLRRSIAAAMVERANIDAFEYLLRFSNVHPGEAQDLKDEILAALRGSPPRRTIARALFVHEYGKGDLFDKWIEHGGDTDEANAMLTKSLARADAVLSAIQD